MIQRRHSLAALAAMAMPAWAQLRVEIAGVGSTRFPITVAEFRDEAKTPQPIAAIIRADLERSGLFRSIDAPAGFPLAETSTPLGPTGAGAAPMRWWAAPSPAWPTAALTCATSSGTRSIART